LRRSEVPLQRVLAIGDSLRTDLAGAASLGVDFLFLTAGIHAGEIGGDANSDPKTLKLFFEESRMPKAVMHRLVW
jgi:ribonucleotide monophosphatase NagD (HAD superfamily)